MKIKVVPGYYAPKLDNIINNDDKIHCVVWPRCNFRCVFCDFWQRDNIVFKEISLSNFEKVVKHLLPLGNAFKFTGGEPCLNPELFQMLEIVKDQGGICFLDTNGSMPNKVTKCIDAGLVDVLAVSLKSLELDKICKTTGISNKNLCWDNVCETIAYASASNTKTIVTKVIYDDFSYNELEAFAKIIRALGDNIYLKINNLMVNEYNASMRPVSQEKVTNIINTFLSNNKDFIGRIIYIGDKKAVTDINCIQHY